MSSTLINLLDTVPASQAQKIKTVEGQLWGTFRALAETEGNVHLLATLKGLGLATNEVRSFVEKQTLHKRTSKAMDYKVLASAMKSKLSDAVSFM